MLRSFGPAMGRVTLREALRASLGGLAAICIVGLFLLSPELDLEFGLYLVAPFGASSVMMFAVPNSPLAQPWSAIVGNTLGALIGVALCLTVADPVLRGGLAVGCAILAMTLARAVHPPGGAVALTAVLHPDEVLPLGFWFALTPIALGTMALVVLAMIYARLTGRAYPFRQFDTPGKSGAQDGSASTRLGLSEAQLTGILERYRQSFNLGAEDLARLIGAAQMEAAAQSTGPLTAQDIMSRDIVTVAPETSLAQVARLFRRHRFTTLPVAGPDGGFRGIIFQIDLISRASEDADILKGRFRLAMRRLLGQGGPRPVTAADIMRAGVTGVAPDTPLAALLPIMADGDIHAVPVTDAGRVVGLVSRTDLVAVLARRAALGAG